MLYILTFLYIYIHVYQKLIGLEQFSDFGTSFIPSQNLNSSFFCILSTRGFPPEGLPYIFPSGLTYISEVNFTPSIFHWEAYTFFSNSNSHEQHYRFSPKIVLSPQLAQSFFNEEYIKIPSFNLLSYSLLNITLFNDSIHIKLITFDDNEYLSGFVMQKSLNDSMIFPRFYRTTHGNLTGLSNTEIILPTYPKRSLLYDVEIYEPFPLFCRPVLSTFSTNCNHIEFFQYKILKNSDKIIKYQYININFSLKLSNNDKNFSYDNKYNCNFSYYYQCPFLHWSVFPQNPERGFITGPDFIQIKQNNNNKTIVFSNIVSFILPSPDFSMVYNTPIMVGFIYSMFFAITLRAVFQKIKSTPTN